MNCRSCGGNSFGDVIDLGMMPLVNNLLESPEAACPKWPLKVVFCRGCSLTQLTECPAPDLMFREYCYFSSQSQTMVEHGRDLVSRHVKPGQKVAEIASNDGYLLRHAQDLGCSVLGIDPAENIAAYANQQGVPTRCDYFNAETAQTIRQEWGRPEVMFANNVLAHVPDPNEIAAGIRILLAKNGIAHIEAPYLVKMIDTGAFDTIYHEHQCYLSVSALKELFHRHDLRIIGVEVVPIHGGSLHLRIAHEGDESQAEQYCQRERELGLFDDAYYQRFADRVHSIRKGLLREMQKHKHIGAYGAAAKAVVMLNYFNLDISSIPWVADISPHKQNHFIPGTQQPIVTPGKLLEVKPDACIVFPWNITEEITRRNREYLDAGGCFIVPIPEVRVL